MPNLALKELLTKKYLLMAYGLYLAVFVWLITFGSFNLLGRDIFGGFYDAQAQSLAHGRLDIMYQGLVNGEEFVRDGKNYIYFGFAPALLRIPFEVFPPLRVRMSRTFVTLGCLLSLTIVGLFLFQMITPRTKGEKFLTVLYLLLMGLGSTNIFLGSFSFVYHEAIALGCGFALLFYFLLTLYLRGKLQLKFSWLFGVLFLCVFSRQTFGLGLLFALFLVFLDHLRKKGLRPFLKKEKGLHWIILTPVTIVLLIVATNWIKFRTVFDSVPIKYYIQMKNDPARLQKVGGKPLHIENLRSNFYNLFINYNINFDSKPPFVSFGEKSKIFPEAIIDINEVSSSIPSTMPLIFLLSLFGLVGLFQRRKELRPYIIVTLGSVFGTLPLFFAIGINERYLHEFFPFLALTSIVGFQALLGSYKKLGGQGKAVFCSLATVLVSLQILLNIGLAFDYQHTRLWCVPAAEKEWYQNMKKRY